MFVFFTLKIEQIKFDLFLCYINLETKKIIIHDCSVGTNSDLTHFVSEVTQDGFNHFLTVQSNKRLEIPRKHEHKLLIAIPPADISGRDLFYTLKKYILLLFTIFNIYPIFNTVIISMWHIKRQMPMFFLQDNVFLM